MLLTTTSTNKMIKPRLQIATERKETDFFLTSYLLSKIISCPMMVIRILIGFRLHSKSLCFKEFDLNTTVPFPDINTIY